MEISRFLLDRSETEGIEPLGVFAAATGADFRCFWSSPEERRTLVGVGIAAEWVGDGDSEIFREAADFVSELNFDGDMPVLLGGFAFRCSADAHRSFADGWGGFPSGRLVLPEVLLSFPAADADKIEEAAVILAGSKSERLLEELISKARELSEADPANLATSSVCEADTQTCGELSETDAANPATADLETADTEISSFADQEPAGYGYETSGRQQAEQETSTTDFRRLLHEAVEAVVSGELEKVVVARQVRHAFSPAPEDVLRRLCERGGSSTVFAFASAGGAGSGATGSVFAGEMPVVSSDVFANAGSGATRSIFAGASPELLAAKSGECFTSLALAGSKPLSEADLLLSDPKELAEHQYVVDHLRSRLADTEADLAVTGPPEVLRLANIAHLASSVSGETSDGILGLVEALHPSPAVAGVPTDAALEFLRQHEQFDRGWYAGPVGWLTPDGDGRFFVALRSVLLNPDECVLFAGSGIVEGSCPEKEEQETWLKLQTAMEALLPPSPPNSTSPPNSPSPANSRPLAV